MAARRRRRGRAAAGSPGEPALLIAGVVALVLAYAVVHFLFVHWWLLLLLGLAAGGGGVALWQGRRQRRARAAEQLRTLRLHLAELDALRHDGFEYAIRDLLRRDGARAERTGGAGDQGCDVRAVDPLGRVWIFQAKHRRDGLAGSAVGTPDLQRLNGTARPVHGADVVVAVTNGRFSTRAPAFAKAQRIHLVDRSLLARWAAGPHPLWQLLDKLPAPARRGLIR